MDNPKAKARLEIVMYGAKNEFGMDRISVEVSGETLYSIAAQLKNIGNKSGNQFFYETETTKIWLNGSVEWESEEQRQKYLAENKYVPFDDPIYKQPM